MEQQLIDALIKVGYIMEGCEKNDDLDILNRIIKHFLLIHCQHEVETDHIDITPETSKTIHYCKKCHHTFDK